MNKYTKNNTTYHEWFERDRAHIELRDCQENTLIELWDDNVRIALEDGLINYKDFHGSLLNLVNLGVNL
jgi:hypothetical protein